MDTASMLLAFIFGVPERGVAGVLDCGGFAMSKPWDNEPTPVTDFAKKSGEHIGLQREYDNVVAVSRNLERRMRAAEKLLQRWGKEIEMAEFYYGWEKDLDAHLEAAKKEDAQ